MDNLKQGPSNYIYLNAMGFYRLAAPAFDDNALLEQAPMAVVANLALCVELLLKCSDAGVRTQPKTPSEKSEEQLIPNAFVFTNAKASGHALDSVFDKISQPIREKLEQLYLDATNHCLREDLIKCRDYFVHARYAYEQTHAHPYDISAIKRLADGLNQALLKGWAFAPTTRPNYVKK